MAKQYSANSTTGSSNSAKMFFGNKTRTCPICADSELKVDYKNPELLKQFISEGGRILPSRVVNTCNKHQRHIKKAIKHSRILSLLPFVFLRK
jgi:small subunit ribosomal protein S18